MDKKILNNIPPGSERLFNVVNYNIENGPPPVYSSRSYIESEMKRELKDAGSWGRYSKARTKKPKMSKFISPNKKSK